jgi:hypothetical protein
VTALEDAMDSGEYEDLMWRSDNWHRQAPKIRSGCLILNKSTKDTQHDSRFQQLLSTQSWDSARCLQSSGRTLQLSSRVL